MPLQLRLLRAFAFLLFAISLLAAIAANIVTIAPRTINVIDEKGELIGRGIIPADYSGAIFWTLLCAIFAGLQLWTVLAVIRYRSESRNKS